MLEVVFETRATDELAGFLRDDPAGVAAVLDAVDQWRPDPEPIPSLGLGGAAHRLRVGRYRVWFVVSATTVTVLRVGRVASG